MYCFSPTYRACYLVMNDNFIVMTSFVPNLGRLLFMSIFSSRYLQAECLTIFFRIVPAVKKIPKNPPKKPPKRIYLFYLKK